MVRNGGTDPKALNGGALQKKVQELEKSLQAKERANEALKEGIKGNLAMLKEFEALEVKERAKAKKREKELKKKLEREEKEKEQLADKLSAAEKRVQELEQQLKQQQQLLVAASSQALVPTSRALVPASASSSPPSYAGGFDGFIRDVELICGSLQRKIDEVKQPQLLKDDSEDIALSAADEEQVKRFNSSFGAHAEPPPPPPRKALAVAPPLRIGTMGRRQSAAAVSGLSKLRRATRKVTIINTLTKKKFTKWSKTLRRMDPRFQILSFFDSVAQKGADSMVDCDVHITGVCTKRCLDDDDEELKSRISNIRRSSVFATANDAVTASTVFNQAGIFSVWRPTSLDSIRKMVTGDGVGKGLDIKGKSAKMGQFSGFVPFLQFHEDRHKKMLRTVPIDARMRIFYSTKEFRNVAHQVLLSTTVEMLSGFSTAQKTLERLRIEEEKDEVVDAALNEEMREEAMDKYQWDIRDPTITPLDNYAPKCYGLEVSQRVVLEAYLLRGNVSRPKGSIHETGRGSEPAFQDMNMETLRNCKPDAPRPVLLLKTDDPEFVMDPRYLLMAYEECGSVRPVVSDFDCFLLGTRRINFSKQLPPEQLEIMKWCLGMIERILDLPPSKETWTMRWLEGLKKEYEKGFHVTFPKYGFADPKSYSIMAHAIDRLTEHGSVRHGAECFNYYFPQDLDDEFLVVTNNQPNGPWVKYSKDGLLQFLSDKIDEGFMFPVNPKWALCDRGWKALYDKQMHSDNLATYKAMEAWYPPGSGVREMIARIHAKHPYGFQIADGPYKMENQVYSPLRKAAEDGEEISGDNAMDMALLEVEHDRVLRKAIKAARAVLFSIKLNKLASGGFG